ncbi:MAG: hypothetical protein JXB50_15420 [Spirochaetes bacterium]|nr:hypothetical protein [Spirochaetota bacterium]
MAKKVKENSGERVKLQNELKKLIKNIDEEGLIFLIKQANVILYNMQVDKINNMQLQNQKSGKNKPKANAYDPIEIITGENNSNFIIRIDTTRKFFSVEDFRSMVKICQLDVNEKEKGARLFRWLMNERKDFLIDNNIRDGNNPNLKNLIEMIKSRYKIASK